MSEEKLSSGLGSLVSNCLSTLKRCVGSAVSPSDCNDLDDPEISSNRNQDHEKTPQETMNAIRAIVELGEKRELQAQEIAFLIRSWRQAYCGHTPHTEVINATYVVEMLDITHELIAQFESQDVEFQADYAKDKLGLSASEHWVEGLERVKQEFSANPSRGVAEWLLRPLETMARRIHKLDPYSLSKIFTPQRVLRLLPVAVYGSKCTRELNESLAKTADSTRFDAGLNVYIYPFVPCIVVSGERHVYPFPARGSVDLLRLAAGELLDAQFVKTSGGDVPPLWGWRFLNRPGLSITQDQEQSVIIHAHTGYRWHLTKDEFLTTINKLREFITNNEPWLAVIEDFQMAEGDI